MRLHHEASIPAISASCFEKATFTRDDNGDSRYRHSGRRWGGTLQNRLRAELPGLGEPSQATAPAGERCHERLKLGDDEQIDQ